MTFDNYPGKTEARDFNKWSIALGLEPIVPSIYFFNYIESSFMVEEAQKEIPLKLKSNLMNATKIKERPINPRIPLTPYEKYEVEIYKRIKRDKYFTHYLDNVLKRRADNITMGVANYMVERRVMVLLE